MRFAAHLNNCMAESRLSLAASSSGLNSMTAAPRVPVVHVPGSRLSRLAALPRTQVLSRRYSVFYACVGSAGWLHGLGRGVAEAVLAAVSTSPRLWPWRHRLASGHCAALGWLPCMHRMAARQRGGAGPIGHRPVAGGPLRGPRTIGTAHASSITTGDRADQCSSARRTPRCRLTSHPYPPRPGPRRGCARTARRGCR